MEIPGPYSLSLEKHDVSEIFDESWNYIPTLSLRENYSEDSLELISSEIKELLIDWLWYHEDRFIMILEWSLKNNFSSDDKILIWTYVDELKKYKPETYWF